MVETGAISNAVFIFRAATLLTMKAGMRVILRGGASPNNIYWSAGTGAAFAANCIMQGNVFSGAAGITYAAGCVHHGRYGLLNHLRSILYNIGRNPVDACTNVISAIFDLPACLADV